MFHLSRFFQRAKKSVMKMINANLRKHIKENSTSTNEKYIHQRFFICSFKEELRVNAL